MYFLIILLCASVPLWLNALDKLNVREVLYYTTGVDLTAIEGIEDIHALTLIKRRAGLRKLPESGRRMRCDWPRGR